MKKWVDDNFGPIQKSDDGEKIVQAFWKALSLLPEKKEEEPKKEDPTPETSLYKSKCIFLSYSPKLVFCEFS